MNIVVLAGGLSPERDVSLVTGSNVCQALRENGHNVILMDVFMGREGDDVAHWFEKSEEVSGQGIPGRQKRLLFRTECDCAVSDG